MDVVYVKGKRGRHVPILLTKELLNGMSCLMKFRTAVGVAKQNLYLFACPTRGSTNPLRGCDCVAKTVKSLQLEAPANIRSTKLRKYIATIAQIGCLKEGELEWLSNHLGHSPEVHREYYR